MGIKKAYCLQMDKLVTSSQARVSFLSSENTLYDKFSFYCISCGMRLSGANVHKREELTRENKTSHFKKYSKDKKIEHTSENCKKYNSKTTTSSNKEHNSKTSSGELIVYTKFKLSQIDYEIIDNIKEDNPDFLSTDITQLALDSSIECDIHTTSILKDLVNCFNDLKENNELPNYPLLIEGDQEERHNTYSTVFRNILKLNTNDPTGKRKKLNEQYDIFFKFRVLYGKIQNNYMKKEDKGWSFLISFVNTYEKERYYFRKTVEGKIKLKAMNVRVFIPKEIIIKYSKLSEQYLVDHKNKLLDSFYITNCIPSLQKWEKASGNGTNEELVFEIKNMNHMHITFIGAEELR